jgi:hypothetical protein
VRSALYIGTPSSHNLAASGWLKLTVLASSR